MADFSGLSGLPFVAAGMRPIGDGFDTRVYVSSDGWVLKVAKYSDVLPRLVRERDVLRYLPKISVETPGGYEIIDRSSVLPFGGSYYRQIEGRPCTTLTEDQQRQLGQLMVEIHELVPHRSFPAKPVHHLYWSGFAPYLSEAERQTLRRLFDRYPSKYAVVRWVHGDIWPENLIERDGRLVGLLDWAQCGVGDVADDFAGLAYLPDSVLDGVLRAYLDAGGTVGSEFRQRLLLARLRRELSGLRHAILHPQLGELAESLAKVRGVLSVT
ncbi:MAG: phosphotransferase [Pseudomonadales bacterium]